MRRTTIALLAALEASVAALIGLGAVLVPLMLLWAFHFGLAVDVGVFLRAAADVWLLGHGVDLVVQLDPVNASRIALPGAGDPFPLTIALLGFAFVSAAFGRRIGRRSALAGHGLTGALAAVLVYAVVGTVLALVAGVDGARAATWEGAILPAATMAIGVAIGGIGPSLRRVETAEAGTGAVARALDRLPRGSVEMARAAVRVGAGAAFGVLALGAVLVAVLVALDYATIAGLYQALGAGIDGGIALTVGELAILPNVVVWAAAWLLGPGFAIGEGSMVSSGGTLLGPVPGLPLLGALPAEAPALGGLWLIVPVLLGFVGAWLVSRDPEVDDPAGRQWWMPLAVAVGAAAAAGVVLGLLSWWSAGAAGPGRLVEVGPDGWAVGGVASVTIGIGAVVGGYVARAGRAASDDGTPRAPVADPVVGDDDAGRPHREFVWGRSGR
jgi:hypothetical protein